MRQALEEVNILYSSQFRDTKLCMQFSFSCKEKRFSWVRFCGHLIYLKNLLSVTFFYSKKYSKLHQLQENLLFLGSFLCWPMYPHLFSNSISTLFFLGWARDEEKDGVDTPDQSDGGCTYHTAEVGRSFRISWSWFTEWNVYCRGILF